MQKVAFLTGMIFFHLILYPAVHIYDFHTFTTSLSSFHGFRIPYKPEFFSGSRFATSKVAFITVMIFFHTKYGILRYHAALIT